MGWTPRMQELAERICRHALATGEMPTFAEMARQMKLSRTRITGIWFRIEQWERGRQNRETINYSGRAKAGYMLAVLKDIETAAKMAGRVYPWKQKWQGPKKPEPAKPKRSRPRWLERSWTEFAPPERPPYQARWDYRPRFGDLVECGACHGTAVLDGDWCPVCQGEGTVKHGEKVIHEPPSGLH